jgi:hypothetical protein
VVVEELLTVAFRLVECFVLHGRTLVGRERDFGKLSYGMA